MIALQYKLLGAMERVFEPKSSVNGFVRQRSIAHNALPHVHKRWVLNLDVKDFFPTIHFGRIRGMLMGRPYKVGPGAASVIARICCYQNQLPQGAPTSPILANMVCARLDGQLQRLATHHGCAYSRYADDLSFSTRSRDFPSDLARTNGGWTGNRVVIGDALRDIFRANGFAINEDKSRLQHRDAHQDVTGIVVNELPNVPRSFVRQVRAMLHAWDRHGLPAAQQRFLDRFDRRFRRPGIVPDYRLVVKGKIEFVRMVLGEGDRVYRKLRNWLHDLAPDLVHDSLPIPPGSERQPNELMWQALVKRYEDSILHVEVRKACGKISAGTAFFFRRGLLASAEHLLAGQLAVESAKVPKVVVTEVIPHPRAGDGVDVAILRFPNPAPRIRSMPVDARLPDRGDPVAVLGFPTVSQRLPTLTLMPGWVESLPTDYKGKLQFIQVSVNLAGGASGGPLINAAGSVIGIVTGQAIDEVTEPGIPARAFHQVLPIQHLLEIDDRGIVNPINYGRQRRDRSGIRGLAGSFAHGGVKAKQIMQVLLERLRRFVGRR